jgi:hypothetical protein
MALCAPFGAIKDGVIFYGRRMGLVEFHTQVLPLSSF